MSPWRNWLPRLPFTEKVAGSNPAGDTKRLSKASGSSNRSVKPVLTGVDRNRT